MIQCSNNTGVIVAKNDMDIETLRGKVAQLESELEEARNRISVLEQEILYLKENGILFTLCAKCRKVKNDDGKWSELEIYLYDHISHQITHGICPECVRELYPDYAKG